MLFLRAIILLAVFPILSNASAKIDSIPNTLFSSTEPIELVLQMDMQKVLNDKSEDPEYVPAKLIYKHDANKIRVFNIKIKARGQTRRISDICEFPPLKINFEKESTKNTVFDGQDKIKMMTHCRESDTYQNYTLLEYLSYKTYNVITDYSYQVRMVNVVYQDIRQDYPDIHKIGFVIEDDDLLAKRVGGTITDERIWSPDSCNQDAFDTFSFFQFMIGNTDWWIHTRHNVDIINLKNKDLIPIPFDFDGAGIINTPYAAPSPQLPITNVRDRFFKGSCRTSIDYKNVINLYNLKRTSILSALEEAEFIDNNSKKATMKYIESFYKIINDPDKFDKFLAETCEFLNKTPGLVPSGAQ